ncbi:inhibitor of host transcription [Aeromonas phage Aswh_1]|nr:inhibitor of host transcription [Aeromonas phage Aswh_1]
MSHTLSDFCKAYGWNQPEVTMKLDGMFIHKPSGTELGSIYDLKIDVENRLKKFERQLKKEQREAELNELVPAAIDILKVELPDAEVFKNKTMPNVKYKDIHFYIVLGRTLDSDVIVRFHHPDMNGEQVSKHTGMKVKYETGRENNCIISGLSIEKAASVIEQVATMTGE